MSAPGVPDPNAAPAPAAPVPAPAPAPAPAAAAPPPAPAPAPVPEPSQTSSIPQGVFERIDRLTRDKKVAEERAAALEAQLAAAGAPPAPGAPPVPPAGTPPAPTPAPSLGAAQIEARARELAAQQAFTDRCNGIARQGEAAHADFPMTMARLGALGGLDPAVINASLEIGDAHELLYSLGQDLNEASRIASLAPEQKVVALMKFDLARREKAKTSISAAPPPPPVSVGGGPQPADDALKPTDKSDDWFAKREKEVGKFSGNYDNRVRA